MNRLLSLFVLCSFIFPLTMQAQVMGEFEGDIQSNTLSGNGDRNVVADPSGVLKIGNLVALPGLPVNPLAGEMVYYDGSSWVTVPKGTDGQTLTMCNCVPTWGPCPQVNIGDTFQGGIVFWLDGNGGGLIASPNDTGDVEWGCFPVEITGANGIVIETGKQNTIDILAECFTPNIAADICDDLVLGGYSDWFLPSIDELSEMYFNIGQGAPLGPTNNIGNFGNQSYWSSTETYSGGSRILHFGNGNGSMGVQNSSKNNSLAVRAIRAF